MKKVPLRKVEVDDDNPLPLDYRLQMIEALKTPENPMAGTDYDEMARVLPIIQKLQNAKGQEHILMEDAEHEEIVKRLKTMRLPRNEPVLKTMVDVVAAAPEHKLRPAEPEVA